MNLYFISLDNNDDEDFDLLVRCETADEAVELWREHYRNADLVPDVVHLINPDMVGVLKWHTGGTTLVNDKCRCFAVEEAKKALGVEL